MLLLLYTYCMSEVLLNMLDCRFLKSRTLRSSAASAADTRGQKNSYIHNIHIISHYITHVTHVTSPSHHTASRYTTHYRHHVTDNGHNLLLATCSQQYTLLRSEQCSCYIDINTQAQQTDIPEYTLASHAHKIFLC